ncbi:MAG TPA: GGDEF and EAL domain-containing protein [Alphaproteobacteria bacterium]|nr:GGDEF and EAL domain-containing protein [Alphaproteobacteria bacterium]
MTDISFVAELLSVAGDAAYDWDLNADHIEWFGAWDRIFGGAAAPPADSAAFYNVIHPDDRHLVFGAEAHAIDRDYRVHLADGTTLWVHEHGVAEFGGGRLVRQGGLLRRIEKQSALAAHDEEWQGHDALTGCLNRAHMLKRIERALDAAKASKRVSAYLALGIDKMSFVNEAVGMEAGDGLLRGVAERLAELLPTRAVVGRVGGDMFGLLLPEPIGRDAAMLAERLLQDFRNRPVMTPVAPLHITVSIGSVQVPAVAKSATEAMIFAEQALHDAHQRGRNLYVEYVDSPERMQENRQTLELGERIKRAFKNDGLKLAFQAVVDGRTSEPLFYEALIRMFGDDGQMIAAAKFVPVIEQLGLAFDLDRLVLEMGIRELEAAPDLRLAINISGLTAAQANWPDHVQKVLGPRPDVAKRLIVEITETAAIVDVGETRRFVDSLRELGGQVALDDFGAGFTSIRHLRSLALSIMKIDKDLLHELLKNGEQQHLVRMLIAIARGLGLKTVAEGVETAEVAEWLRRENVDMMQGYYFARPSLEKPWLAGKTSGDGKAPRMADKNAARTGDAPNVIRAAF